MVLPHLFLLSIRRKRVFVGTLVAMFRNLRKNVAQIARMSRPNPCQADVDDSKQNLITLCSACHATVHHGVPCLTLRSNTERPVTVNRLFLTFGVFAIFRPDKQAAEPTGTYKG